MKKQKQKVKMVYLFILVLSSCIIFSYGTIGGIAGGDLNGTYPNPQLAFFGPGALNQIGNATFVPVITVDGTGRVQALTSVEIIRPTSGAAGGVLNGTYPNPTLSSVGITPGTYYNPIITPSTDGRVATLYTAPYGELAMSVTNTYGTVGPNNLLSFDTLSRNSGWLTTNNNTFSPLPFFAGVYMINVNVLATTFAYRSISIYVNNDVLMSSYDSIDVGGVSFSLTGTVALTASSQITIRANDVTQIEGGGYFTTLFITSLRIPA